MTDEDILRHYFGEYVTNKHYISPLRRYSEGREYEDTPSFIIKKKDGKILWCDFGGGFQWKTPIMFVMELFGIGWKEAIKRIRQDEASGVKYNYVVPETPERIAKVVLGELREFELKYWRARYISEKTLDRFRVCSCRELYYNDGLWAMSIPSDPIFYYGHGQAGWTVYRPLADDKKDKFRKKRVTSSLLGLEFLPPKGNILIITKSYKDIMFLTELGFNAVCPQSEVVLLPPAEITILKARFKRVFLVFDNDATGRNKSKAASIEHNLEWWETPEALGKDLTDMCNKVGRYKTLEYIKLKTRW